jgi:hypothetical protein
VLRINAWQCGEGGRDAVRARLADEGVVVEATSRSSLGLRVVSPPKMNVWASPAFCDGLFEVQDEGGSVGCALPAWSEPSGHKLVCV